MSEESVIEIPSPKPSVADCRFVVAVQIEDFDKVRVVGTEGTMKDEDSRQFFYDECTKILAEVRNVSGVSYEQSNVSATEGEAHFTLKSADDADQFCEKLIETLNEHNSRKANPEFHVKILLGIACCRQGVGEKEHAETVRAAFSLANVGRPGDIYVSHSVFEEFSPGTLKKYASEKSSAVAPDGNAKGARGRHIAVAPVEKFAMCVDMSQFSKIQRAYERFHREKGAAILHNEIKKVLVDGCSVTECDYEKVCRKFTGDGGIFIFDSPEEAHVVAVNILKSAERSHNEEARQDSCEDGSLNTSMRCFRIGVAYGNISFEGDDAAGTAISTAARYESGGCSGEIRISEQVYKLLPEAIRRTYSGSEKIQGKEHDPAFPGRRLKVAEPAPWEPAPKPLVENLDFLAEAPAPKKLAECFIISPINSDKRIADVFERLIEPTCRRLGFEPKRADHIAGPDRKEVITEQLTKAPMVIAYLGKPEKGWNNDVMLEIGFRLANRLPLVMIADEVPAAADGRTVSIAKSLPFYLVQSTVVEIPKNPAQVVDKLVEEIEASRKKYVNGTDTWTTVHPIVEAQFSSLDDMVLTEISPEARKLFRFEETEKIADVRKKFRERMSDVQFKAYNREYFEIIAQIDAQARMSGMGEDVVFKMPTSRVPIVFNDEPPGPDGQPVGHLRVIERYTVRNGKIGLRLLFLKVSSSMKKAPEGHWVCDP